MSASKQYKRQRIIKINRTHDIKWQKKLIQSLLINCKCIVTLISLRCCRCEKFTFFFLKIICFVLFCVEHERNFDRQCLKNATYFVFKKNLHVVVFAFFCTRKKLHIQNEQVPIGLNFVFKIFAHFFPALTNVFMISAISCSYMNKIQFPFNIQRARIHFNFIVH